MQKAAKTIISLIVALVLVTASVREFFANDSFAYFRSQPVRLILIAAIALLGGGVFVSWSYLTAAAQRRAILVCAGGFGCIASVFTICLAANVIRLAVALGVFPSWSFISCIASGMALAAFSWVWFFRTLTAPGSVDGRRFEGQFSSKGE